MNFKPKTDVGAHRRCCYGLCKSDPRTKDYYENFNFYFISFPKPCLPFRKRFIPKSDFKKHLKECTLCSTSDRWVRLCGRCDSKFNSIYNIKKDTYICSLHFVGESGPSEKFPEPIPYSASNKPKSLKASIPRKSLQEKYQTASNDKCKSPDKELSFLEPEVSNYEESTLFDDVMIKTEIIEDQNDNMEVFFPNQEGMEISSNSLEELKTTLSCENHLVTIKDEPISPNDESDAFPIIKNSVNSRKRIKRSLPTKIKQKPIEIFEQSLENDKTKSIFYTNLDCSQIKTLFSFLSPKCNNLQYSDENESCGEKKKRELTPRQELLITLMFLRCAFPLQDLAYRFDLPTSLIKNIIITWIQFMFSELSNQLKSSMFVPREKLVEKMSELFKEFHNLRVILVSSEFYCPELPLFNFDNEDHTYSKKEVSIVSKALIGCSPSGRISFVSPVHEGTASNREIFIKSKINNLIVRDDLILIDKEIAIDDLIKSKAALCKVPQFFKESRILQSNNDLKTIFLTRQRNFVALIISRLKQFRILQTEPPYGIKKFMSEILFVCVCIFNLNVKKP